MLIVAFGFGIFLITGCCPDRPIPQPPVQVRTVTIDRPVPTPCVNAADIPIAPKPGLSLTGDAAHDADLLAAQDLALRAALNHSLALLGACIR